MRTHRTPRWDQALVVALVLILVAQGAALLLRDSNRTQFLISPISNLAPSFVSTGSSIPSLTTVGEDGKNGTLDLLANPGELTVLMVFSESCTHADLVTDSWAQWMTDREGAPGLHIVPVTDDEPTQAREYATANGWSVAPVSLSQTTVDSPEVRVLNRTPWVFLLDGDGNVLYEGHGTGLEALDAALAAPSTAALAAGDLPDASIQGG